MGSKETDNGQATIGFPLPAQHPENGLTERQIAVLEWEKAPLKIKSYPAGDYIDGLGILHQYEPGYTLYIADKQVMDSCEMPWVTAGVDMVFAEMAQEIGRKREQGETVTIVDCGFGLGFSATEIVRKLGAGKLIEIELNDKNFARAERWAEGTKRFLSGSVTGMPKITDIPIELELIHGDAIEARRMLLERGEEIDILFSDTFPLTKQEKGINDIIDIEVLAKCISQNGRFVFYPFTPGTEEGSRGGMMSQVHEIISPYFTYRYEEATVSPPEHYKYLQGKDGVPITTLPIIIARPKPLNGRS